LPVQAIEIGVNAISVNWFKLTEIAQKADWYPTVPKLSQGLAVLSAFFMDPNNSRYPPAAITTTDITNEFFVRFPVLAHQLWAGQNYPDYARSLGFP
jgi:hypothetical protein